MSVTSILHINRRGDAADVLRYYQSVFGGDVALAPYGQVPSGQGPGQDEQLAWGQVLAPNGFHVMAYDVQDAKPYDPGTNAYYVALSGTDADEVTGFWEALVDGSTIVEPYGPSVFSPLYGKLTDRFGVTWIISVTVPYAG